MRQGQWFDSGTKTRTKISSTGTRAMTRIVVYPFRSRRFLHISAYCMTSLLLWYHSRFFYWISVFNLEYRRLHPQIYK